jgi:8-oxo-dGTP pyrophosphatase MutT (NUDIX family)
MRMPPQLLERARAVVYGGQWTAPEPRPAATLVLLRDTDRGIEVALLQRAANLGFAGGMYVFPGGALDDADAALGDPWLIAAIRETFEECGVLLATPNPQTELQHLRARDFREVLDELGVEPAASVLHPFSHWITPEVESRRFDTKFYAAELPAGQDIADFTTEHQAIGWFRPADTEGLPMLPPTSAVLAELAQFDTVAAALAPTRKPVPIMPHPVASDHEESGIDWILVDGYTAQPLQ